LRSNDPGNFQDIISAIDIKLRNILSCFRSNDAESSGQGAIQIKFVIPPQAPTSFTAVPTGIIVTLR
jgi:hypothetical protein